MQELEDGWLRQFFDSAGGCQSEADEIGYIQTQKRPDLAIRPFLNFSPLRWERDKSLTLQQLRFRPSSFRWRA